MAVTVETGTYTFTGGQLGLHQNLKLLLEKAGFPTPIQDYTVASPFFLVYELEPNNYIVLSTITATTTTFCIYKSWNTSTRTGTGNEFSPIQAPMSANTTNFGYTTIKTTEEDIGLLAINNSVNTSIATYFGFIKLENKASFYPLNFPSYFTLFSTGTWSYTALEYRLYGTVDKYGGTSYPDLLTRKLAPTNAGLSGKLQLISPVLISSGGNIIGSTSNRIVYCPVLNQKPGLRLIVQEGIEEYIYCGADIAVRDI